VLAEPQSSPLATTRDVAFDKRIDAVAIRGIVDAHLFGTAAAEDAIDQRDLPRARIPLVLTGTIAFDDPSHGFAMLGEKQAHTQVYRVGDMIDANDGRVHSVYADHVVLDRSGKLETVFMPYSNLSGFAPSAAPANTAASSIESTRPNSELLSDVLRIVPAVDKKSGGIGYRVFPNQSHDGMDKLMALGLEPGDLITAIDNNSIRGWDPVETISTLLQTTHSVTFDVKRAGKRIKVVVGT
jgi:type II secretion system protein C